MSEREDEEEEEEVESVFDQEGGSPQNLGASSFSGQTKTSKIRGVEES